VRVVPEALKALIRRNMAISAAINTLFSLAFFIAVFGRPGRDLAWGEPDGLALDFLPQCATVFLMSALVPVLIERRNVAAIMEQPPRSFRAIFGRALVWALMGLCVGGILGVIAIFAGDGEIYG
jgi:hypothetical protein